MLSWLAADAARPVWPVLLDTCTLISLGSVVTRSTCSVGVAAGVVGAVDVSPSSLAAPCSLAARVVS
ncbi:Uncharacterised protein [Mycobacteroides abscessus subsp. abscessus]|nr:Uncharacterised protein [Mycobacteroides abscessus subsp. abscessus]